MKEDGTPTYDTMKLVWGEGNIYEVPKLDDKYIILLSNERKIERSWNGANIGGVHQNLVPGLKILRQLDPKEIEEWKLKIDKK